jgi:hypothetical protein
MCSASVFARESIALSIRSKSDLSPVRNIICAIVILSLNQQSKGGWSVNGRLRYRKGQGFSQIVV